MFTCKKNFEGKPKFPHVKFMYFKCMGDLKCENCKISWKEIPQNYTENINTLAIQDHHLIKKFQVL